MTKLFESELTRAIKKSEQSTKVKDKNRKSGDDEKIDNDIEAGELEKDSKPVKPKKSVPGEGELMAREIDAVSDLEGAEANLDNAVSDEVDDENDEEEKKSKNESFRDLFN